jgi:hypothetical protein
VTRVYAAARESYLSYVVTFGELQSALLRDDSATVVDVVRRAETLTSRDRKAALLAIDDVVRREPRRSREHVVALLAVA